MHELKTEFQALRAYIDLEVNGLRDELKQANPHGVQPANNVDEVMHKSMLIRLAALEKRMLNFVTHVG